MKRVARILCAIRGHAWRDHWRFEDMNTERRANRGEPLVRDCTRCGRVESCAFTGRWTRAEHLERGWVSPHSPAYDLDGSVLPLTDLGAPPKGDWCGSCGYTGHCKGPRQAACRQWIWHAHLEHEVDLRMPWVPTDERVAP